MTQEEKELLSEFIGWVYFPEKDCFLKPLESNLKEHTDVCYGDDHEVLLTQVCRKLKGE